MRKLFFILFLIPSMVFCQTGGKNAFPFLNLSFDARTASLGRLLITAFDDDLNTGVQNPASLNSKMENSFGVSQALMAGGINHGMFAYAKDIKNVGTGILNLKYVAYGKMERTDEFGHSIGTFSPGDFELSGGLGRTLNENLSIGASFGLIWSQLDTYNSFGFSFDIAGMYRTRNENLTVSAVVKNIGFQLTAYNEKNRKALPIHPMLGVSYKLPYAPFRFSVVMHHLHQWDLTYNDPNAKPTTDPLTGELIPVKGAKWGEKFGRHFLVQSEVLIGKIARIRIAYDYNQRREMLVVNHPGMGGFSFGAGIHFHYLAIDYGMFVYSTAGMSHLLSLRTNMNNWKTKPEKKEKKMNKVKSTDKEIENNIQRIK